jgi:hypothetical protein
MIIFLTPFGCQLAFCPKPALSFSLWQAISGCFFSHLPDIILASKAAFQYPF